MSFLTNYKIFSSGDEAPPEYHDWAGISILSACCGPNLWLDMGKFNIQPNLYILFVGPPGIRKSTAKDVAQSFVREVGKIPMVPASSTKESMIASFTEKKDNRFRMVYEWNGKPRYYTKACIFSDEFINLVSAGGDPLGWIQLLTELYNPKPTFDVSTISRGNGELPYPYMHLLGCLTPELTSNLISQGALSGGFSRRTLYIYSNKIGKPVARPTLSPEQTAAKELAIIRAREVQKLQGRFEFTGPGWNTYETWYTKNHYEKVQASTQAVTNFLQSKPDQVLKLAMLHSVSSKDTLELTTTDLEFAIERANVAQEHIGHVFAAVGRNPHAATIAGILSFIEQKTSNHPFYITTKRIFGNFVKDASSIDLSRILSDLTQTDPPQLHKNRVTIAGQSLEVYTSPSYIEDFRRSQKGPPPPQGPGPTPAS